MGTNDKVWQSLINMGKHSKRLTTLLQKLILIVGLFFSAHASAEFYLSPLNLNFTEIGRWDLDAELQQYSTTANYDGEGTSFAPSATFEKVALIRNNNLVKWGFSYGWTAFVRFNWTRTRLVDGSDSGTSFGLGDQTLGMAFRLIGNEETPFRLFAQIQADLAAYDNTQAATDGLPFLGDGSTDLTISTFAKLNLGDPGLTETSLLGGLGYTFRSAGYSAAIPFNVKFLYAQNQKGFGFEAGLSGILSLNNDTRTDSVTTAQPTVSGLGGSYLVNAINPTLMRVEGKATYRFSPSILAYVGAQSAIRGEFAPKGTGILGGIRWTLSGADERYETTTDETGKPKKKIKDEKANRGFIKYGSIQARITKVSDRLNRFKIDRGRADKVKKGDTFDIFSVDENGKLEEAIARAEVTHLKRNAAALKIVEFYKEVSIKEGFIVKKPLD